MRYIIDDEFVEVSACGSRKMAPQRTVNDFEVALFKTRKGAVIKLAISKTRKRVSMSYFCVYGSTGSAEWDRHYREPGWLLFQKTTRISGSAVTMKRWRKFG